jgi:hypothetical protein
LSVGKILTCTYIRMKHDQKIILIR